jgi:hypothetical protein
MDHKGNHRFHYKTNTGKSPQVSNFSIVKCVKNLSAVFRYKKSIEKRVYYLL